MRRSLWVMSALLLFLGGCTEVAGSPEAPADVTGDSTFSVDPDTGPLAGDTSELADVAPLPVTDTSEPADVAPPPVTDTSAPDASAPDISAPDTDTGPVASCGDETCAVGETAVSCPQDCPAACEDGQCTHEETAVSCPQDCPAVCGDAVCTEGESALTCPDDCPAGCGDTVCTEGEGAVSCPQDCPSVCGDAVCTEGESALTCPDDCPTVCGDGACTDGESSVDCPGDCAPIDCDPVPPPQAPSAAPHPGVTPGSWETTTADGFTDDYLVRSDGELKIGIRREWGATIIFFGASGDGPGTNTTNTIDSHDTGREVQVAFYDASRIVQGCAHDASCQNGGGPCVNSITFLGWNPVQGGNECNNGSGTEWVTADTGVLTSQTQPLFWNPDWEKQGCENGGCADPALSSLKSDVLYTQSLRWVSDHVVEMTMTVQNLSALDHPTTLQEFPTLYATFGAQGTQDLNVILDSTGAQIAIDQPANDGFFVKEFDSPGGWAALQNSTQTYGVGLYYENELGSFQGWQKADVFNNIRSKFPFAIPAFGSVSGRAYLVLGAYGTIGAEVAALQTGLAPFGTLESPSPDAKLESPNLTIEGWVLDNRGVTEVRVLIDGGVVATTPPNTTREDVCLSWPLYPGCPQVGFEVDLDVSGFSPCGHLLEIEAVDTDGNTRVIGRERLYLGGSEPPPPSCGDGQCTGGESASSCSADCAASCGDGSCAEDENNEGCPSDCPPVCGDGFCAAGEVCVADCGGPDSPWEKVLVHRYYFGNGPDQDHMFGLDESPPEGYIYEGPAFHLYANPQPGLTPFYQSYCASCTDHLQGTSGDEGTPNYTGHTILGYCGTSQKADTPTALQRVYGATQTDHFVTSNAGEISTLEGMGYALESVYWVP